MLGFGLLWCFLYDGFGILGKGFGVVELISMPNGRWSVFRLPHHG